MTEAAKESGTDVPHEKLSKQLTIKEAGYVYIYLSNDNAALDGNSIEVYFDDMKIEHIKSPVIQAEDYYPFGLTFSDYRRENALLNRYQYNGKELQTALELNVLDYGARMYMSDIGRWQILDPLASKYYDISPFAYVADNPVKFIDPDGKRIIISGTAEFKKAALNSLQKLTNDKLVLRKDGTVVIASLGTVNGGKNLNSGTNLIRGLNGKGPNDHTHTIVESKTGNGSTALNKMNAENGEGSDTKIEYNPNKTTGAAKDVNGSYDRPAEIGLAHELIHSSHAEQGKQDSTKDT